MRCVVSTIMAAIMFRPRLNPLRGREPDDQMTCREKIQKIMVNINFNPNN